MKNLLPFLLIFLCSGLRAQKHKLVQLWKSDSLAVPESAHLNKKNNFLFVSVIDGIGNVTDGRGGVVKVDLKGKTIDEKFIVGLNAPKGLGLTKKHLYIADLKQVIKANARTGKIIEKILINEAIFLNDIAISKNQKVFVSDTRLGKIYCLENGKPKLWLDQIKDANGLKFINDTLLVLSGTQLLKISMDKQITVLSTGFGKNGDGIEVLKNGDYIVTCWSGLVYYVSKNGDKELLLDTQELKINTADLAIDINNDIIYIPTFNNNRILAFKLQKIK